MSGHHIPGLKGLKRCKFHTSKTTPDRCRFNNSYGPSGTRLHGPSELFSGGHSGVRAGQGGPL